MPCEAHEPLNVLSNDNDAKENLVYSSSAYAEEVDEQFASSSTVADADMLAVLPLRSGVEATLSGIVFSGMMRLVADTLGLSTTKELRGVIRPRTGTTYAGIARVGCTQLAIDGLWLAVLHYINVSISKRARSVNQRSTYLGESEGWVIQTG